MRLSIALCLVLVIVSPMVGQNDSGTISGSVEPQEKSSDGTTQQAPPGTIVYLIPDTPEVETAAVTYKSCMTARKKDCRMPYSLVTSSLLMPNWTFEFHNVKRGRYLIVASASPDWFGYRTIYPGEYWADVFVDHLYK